MDKELVAEWFRFADDDIDTVLLLKEMRPQHREIICYHCEQADYLEKNKWIIPNAKP